jgi:peptidoglycan hydrolase FlgJ
LILSLQNLPSLAPASGPVSVSASSENAGAAGTRDVAKIKKVAKEFEAVLLNSLLGPIEKSFALLPGANSDSAASQYQSMETQALSTALANAGGLGIADMIVRNLLHSNDVKASPLPKVSLP